MRPVGMIEARMQPVAPFLAFRQMLEQQPARGPVAVAFLRRQPDEAGDLLGLREITLRRLAEVAAFTWHDALVALVGDRLVEGDRQKALAEQLLERRVGRSRGKLLRIMADVAAQLAAEIVADEQVHDPAPGLCLQRELPLRLLQQRAE